MDRINFTPNLATQTGANIKKPTLPPVKADKVQAKEAVAEEQIKDSIELNDDVPSFDIQKNIPHASITQDENFESNPEKDVTFLFYMNGQYGDLEQSMASSILGLEKVGSDDNVNLVAQLGRAAQREAHPSGGFDRIDNDWSGVRRYYINKSPTPHKEEVALETWQAIEREIPDNPLIHFTLGDVYTKKGDTVNADKEYDKAKELGYQKFLDSPFDADVARWSDEFDDNLQPLRDAEANNNVYASPVAEFKRNVSMMHPQNLQDFVSWGVKKYPAKNYVLVLMGHGGAWTGSMKMSPSEIGMAVQAGMHEANRDSGRNDKLDAIIFNSCYMGNLETVSQLRDAADITVASEMSARTEVFYHWPEVLTKVQTILKNKEEFVPRKLARDFVSFYKDVGETNSTRDPIVRRSKESYLTLVALDNKKIGALTDAWKGFIQRWDELGVEDSKIFADIKKSKNFPSFAFSQETMFDYGTLRDIGSIALNVINDPNVPVLLKIECRNIRKTLRDAIIEEQHTGFNMEGASGLTVWAPTNAADISTMNAIYGDRVPQFVQETGWGDKLEDSVKNVDNQSLQEFVRTMQALGNIQKMFEVPGLTPKEIEGLETRANILEEEAFQLRQELDLSIPHTPDFSPEKQGFIREAPRSETSAAGSPVGNISIAASHKEKEGLLEDVGKKIANNSDKSTGMASLEPGIRVNSMGFIEPK